MIARLFWSVAIVAVLCSVGAAAEPAIELKPVKLAGLKEAIARHKGKIVVVDFWATFCLPCKEEFPNLVKLHSERAKDGVVCISVSVDDPDDKAGALKFLTQQKAAFENYLLDESADAYQKAFEFSSVPTVLVYGRDGKLVRKFNSDKPENAFNYKDVRKLIDALVK